MIKAKPSTKRTVAKKATVAKRAVGRPARTLTEEQISELKTLGALLNNGQIADYFGIPESTFYEILKRDARVSGELKKGQAKAVAMVAQGVLQRAREGDNAAAFFYLKTRAGWSEKATLELTGKDGGPIKTEKGLSKEALEKIEAKAKLL